jgi:hypothetical protein
VSAIVSPSFPLSALVVAPVRRRSIDVPLLAPLRAADEQDDQLVAVPAEIDPVAGADIDPPLGNALADRLHVPEITGLHPGERGAHLQCGTSVEAFEPVGKRTRAFLGLVLDDVNHTL